MLYLYRHRADTSTSGYHQDLPESLPSRPPMPPAPAIARRPFYLPQQRRGGEYCHPNNRECDMLCLYRHRADTSTSGNHQDLPYPLPSRPLMPPPPASARRPRDLPQQRGGGEYCHTNNRECDMLYLYRHRADTSTSGNHQDLPHPLPSCPPMLPAPAIARRPFDLPQQRGRGEYCHPNNRECDMLYLYRHRADTSTSGNHQDLPYPLPSRPPMRSPSASARRPCDLPVQRRGGEYCHTNNRECDMLYLYRHRAGTSTSGNHQDLPHPLPSRPPMRSPSASAPCPRDLQTQQQGGGESCPPNNRECDMLYLYRHRADTSTSGNHQDLPYPLPSRPPMRSPSASARRLCDLPVQRRGGEYCHTNNRECDMLYLYRHRAGISTSGNHQDLPHPLPSRPPMCSPSASGRRPRDLSQQHRGGESCPTNNRECDMLYLYRHRADISTSSYHQDLPQPLPSRPPMRSPSASGRRPRDLPQQQGGGEYSHTNNRECDMLYLYRHRADTSTSGNHQDLPHPLPSRPPMPPIQAIPRRPRDLPVQQGGGEYRHTNNRECDMLYLYRHRADTSTSGNHQDLPYPLPSRPPMPPTQAIPRRPRDLPVQQGGGGCSDPNNRECDMLYLYRHRAGTITICVKNVNRHTHINIIY